MMVNKDSELGDNGGGPYRQYTILSLVPTPVLLGLLPSLSAAFLVGAGEEFAKLLVAILGDPKCSDNINQCKQSVYDVQAFLLIVNFPFSLWIFDQILNLEQTSTTKNIDLAARLSTFLGAFVVLVDLLRIAVASENLAILAYAAFVIFTFLVAPVLLLEITAATSSHQRVKAQPGETAEIRAALRLTIRVLARASVYAVLVTVLTMILPLTLYVILNDGIPWLGVPSLIRDVFNLSARAEFWGINPAILAAGAAQLTVFEFNRIFAGALKLGPCDRRFGLDFRYRPKLLLAGIALAILINVFAGLVLIGDNATTYNITTEITTEVLVLAKGAFAAVCMLCFFGAYYLARAAQPLAGQLVVRLLALVIFAVGGACLGAAIAGFRTGWLGHDSVHWHVVWMQALAFVFAAIGLILAAWFTDRTTPRTEPLL